MDETLHYEKLKFKSLMTRKPHICASCREVIEANSWADYHVYIDDDMKFVAEYYHSHYSCPKFEDA